MATGSQGVSARREVTGIDSARFQQFQVSQIDAVPLDASTDAFTGRRGKVRNRRDLNAPRRSGGDDRRRERVRTSALHRRRQPKQVVFSRAGRHLDRGYLRTALGERPGLVDDESADAAQEL